VHGHNQGRDEKHAAHVAVHERRLMIT
jgi:hypothetical protein